MKIWKMVILSLLLSLLFGMTSYAGNINADEQRLIDAISSPVTYNGKQYVAKQSYIRRVIAYVNQDNVNLSSAQVDKAILKFYDSIAEGISGGYMEEIPSNKPSPEPQEGTTPAATPEKGMDPDDTIGSENDPDTKKTETHFETETESNSTQKDASKIDDDARLQREKEILDYIFEEYSLPEEETDFYGESVTETETETETEIQSRTEENQKDFSHAGVFKKGTNITAIAAGVALAVAAGCAATVYIKKKQYRSHNK